jgi:hypothetical protein
MSARLPAEAIDLARERRVDPAIYLGVAVAIAISVVVVYMPILALPAVGAALAVLVLNLGERVPRVFLWILMALLIGYAFLGRGLAHVGAPPVYVGEMAVGLALLTLAIRLGRLSFGPFEWLIIAFMLWGAARTLPFYGTYGQDSLRDAVLWGYAVFALAIPAALSTDTFPNARTTRVTPFRQDSGSLTLQDQNWGASRLQSRDRTRTILGTFQTCVPLFLLWVPIVGLIASGVEFPKGPGSDVGIVGFKGGDMGVHLGGIAAFLALGLYSETPGWRLPLAAVWTAWLGAVVVAGGHNRGGLVAAGISMLVAFAFRPTARAVQFAGIVGLIVLVAAIANIRIDIGDSGKEISVDAMSRRITSVFGNDDDEALEGTRSYRLEWWDKIVGYTFGGPYFWGGKGFGVNLATDDGFQFEAEESHRAPHNSHMTVLARMGVPGLALWIVMQAAFGVSLFLAMRRAQTAGLTRWASIDAWLLIYWLAICINTSFDPYLEGPQGGIWFWSIIGIGLYVLRLQARDLDEHERAERRRIFMHARLRAKAGAMKDVQA